MKKQIIWVICIGIVAYLLFGIHWSNSWELKKHCFHPTTLTIPELFQLKNNVLWEEKEREDYPEFVWNVPYLVTFSGSQQEEQIIALGIAGFLKDGSSWEQGARLLERNTSVRLNGNVIVHHLGILSSFVNQFSVLTSLTAEVEGKTYLVYGFSLADNIKEKFITNKCYEGNI
ncbi:hypothetical protein [Paraglaciecola hydrolytica]|uniref:Uncharacterized protein n=1 Tax=Paraglaciecola hydrolytica TaxID=1799789 RepID=A0A136A0V4_9ALTE|nr:hypothetical protein [Paraglaciecola hydrolytica]KXI28862.1 hypothetical protein AX660_11755 [Paraglaciecola hydrolytica]